MALRTDAAEWRSDLRGDGSPRELHVSEVTQVSARAALCDSVQCCLRAAANERSRPRRFNRRSLPQCLLILRTVALREALEELRDEGEALDGAARLQRMAFFHSHRNLTIALAMLAGLGAGLMLVLFWLNFRMGPTVKARVEKVVAERFDSDVKLDKLDIQLLPSPHI